MATFPGIIIASIYGKLDDNSFISVMILSFLPTDWVQTFSNELFPLRIPKIIIVIETTAHPPLPTSLLTIIHNCLCVFLSSKFSKYLSNDDKVKSTFHGGVTVNRGRSGLPDSGVGDLVPWAFLEAESHVYQVCG